MLENLCDKYLSDYTHENTYWMVRGHMNYAGNVSPGTFNICLSCLFVCLFVNPYIYNYITDQVEIWWVYSMGPREGFRPNFFTIATTLATAY